MKKNIFKIFTLISVLIILLTGCNEEPVFYERKVVEGTAVANVSSDGVQYKNGIVLDFSQEPDNYTLYPMIAKGSNSTTECQECGYTEFNGEKAYKICANAGKHAGFLVKFAIPFSRDVIEGATISFMTNEEAGKSEVRVLKADEDNKGDVLNSETSISGASSDWKNISLGINSFDKFANDDGLIEGFQFYVYNRDGIDFYLKDITLKIDAEEMCNVSLSTMAVGEQGAVEDVANQIKNIFEGANIASNITVTCEEYFQNTVNESGTIKYSIDVDVGNNKIFSYSSIEKEIPALSNAWLEGEDYYYGVRQTVDEKCKSSFTDAGTLLISNSKIECLDAVIGMEYAVIEKDADYKSSDIVWHDINCSINGDTISNLALNSYLDYEDKIVDGNSYKLVLRAVTSNENYILHFEKDFTYKAYSNEKNQALKDAMAVVKDAKVFLSKDNASAENLSKKLEELLDSSSVAVVAKLNSQNLTTSQFDVSVTYPDKDFAGCSGDAFTVENFKVWHSEEDADKAIIPVYPNDGQKNINIASDEVLKLINAKYEDYTKDSYGYELGEFCTPVPVTFEWSDKNFTEGKKYTLYISENSDMSEAYKVESKETKAQVYNLKSGVHYYWYVESGNETSPVFTFKTKAGITRFINANGIQNFRDIGGYVTLDNKLIKQGLIYRAAELDYAKKDGKDVFMNQLGIKTDVDLRAANDGKSPISDNIAYKNFPIQWYNNIFESDSTEKLIGKTIKLFADENNYPVCFHCSLGRDRTGTISILLLGILGVDEQTIIKEYHMSLLSYKGFSDDAPLSALELNITAMWEQLDNYGDENATINDKIVNFLLTETGVTQEEIDSIRNIMLQELPADYYEEDSKQSNSNANTGIAQKADNDQNNMVIIIILSVCGAIVIGAVAVIVLVSKKKKTPEAEQETSNDEPKSENDINSEKE